MDTGKILFGAILLIISIWLFIAMTDFNARFLGGSIVGVIALATILTGIFKKKK